MEYFEIYKKRINRYGTNFQERIQNQREKAFKIRVLKSVYKVEFDYDGKMYLGTLERNTQNNTETIQFLLTDIDVNIPIGTIIPIKDINGKQNQWMIYYLEQIQASGYNKYIVLKMTHLIKWKDQNDIARESWGYVYGQEDNMLKDELRSRSRTHVLYTENIKLNFIVMPVNKYMVKDTYFTLETSGITEAYKVTGYDIVSTPGVMFISMDPTFIRNTKSETIVPITPEGGDTSFWITGKISEEEIK